MRTSIFLFIALISLEWAQAQIAFPDTTFNDNYTAVRRQYDLSMNQQAALYNGIQHVGYGRFIIGTAYFLTQEWLTGSILYDGMMYKNIPIHYDLVAGDVIVQSPNGFGISLFSPRVKYFSLGGHQFLNINDPAVALSPGFYEVLLQGTMTILVKRHKRINEFITGLEQQREFVQEDVFYLMIDGRIHSIRNVDDILQFTGNRKKEMKRLLRKNHIRFKREMEPAIKLIAGTYNQSK